MPVLYVYSISLILDRGVFNDFFDYIGLLLSLSAIIILKQMGVAFAMLVYLYYMICLAVEWRRKRLYSKEVENSYAKLKWLFKTAVLFGMPVLSYVSWGKYIDSLKISGQFSLSKIKVDELIGILLGGVELRYSVVHTNHMF